MSRPLVELRAVVHRFGRPRRGLGRLGERMRLLTHRPVVQAVGGVDLTIRAGEVVGLVGESGCGKSTLGRIVAGIIEPTEGEVRVGGQALAALSTTDRMRARLGVQMIFQDPFSSLNPRQRVAEIIGEAPRFHRLAGDDPDAFVDSQLRRVGIDPAYKRRYPHQFSGGQRQRIGIARALAVGPALLVCDEAVASLDVLIQAQILNLFMELKESLGLTYLFISHDLGVVRHIADRVVIMYLGRIVEEGPARALFAAPRHPYTRALIAEVPTVEGRHKRFTTIRGEIPSPAAPPPGCHFHPRCPHVMPRCRIEAPILRTVGTGQRIACHLEETMPIPAPERPDHAPA